jgi:Protein of unknown function (DUF3833)
MLQKLQDPLAAQHGFELTSFLEGQSRASGIFEDRFGKLRRRFEAAMSGVWRSDIFELTEDFLFDDGERLTRVWRLKPGDAGKFAAETEEIAAPAQGLQGEIRCELTYRMRLGKLWFKFEDVFYPASGDMLLNRARVSKFGITVGYVTVVFRR